MPSPRVVFLRRLIAIALSLVVCSATSAPAAWNANGNPVCTAAGAQTAPTALPDGAGGMFVFWLDARPGATGMYAQRILGDGTIAPGWPADGVRLSGTSTTNTPCPVPDGAGGALVVWLSGADIRAQRIDANGALHAGWPADGMMILPNDLTMPHSFGAASDGAGGAYIGRVKHDSFERWTVRVTRITSDGAFVAGWPATGISLWGAFQVSFRDLKADPAGGVICGIRYQDDAGPQNFNRGRICRILPDATLQLSDDCTPYISGGLAPGGIMLVAVAPDGTGGAYGTWADAASPGGTFGQHFLSSGQDQWATPYAMVCDQTLQDGLVGVWFAALTTGPSLVAHRRLADGTLPSGWTSSGVTFKTTPNFQSYRFVAMPNELVAGWSDNSGGTYDIYASSVGRDGTISPIWTPGGTLVCAANGDQVAAFIVDDGQSGVLACWEDRRPNASVSDIYANRVLLPPPVAVGPRGSRDFGIHGAWPNPARDRIEVAFTLSGDATATLEVIDLAGRAFHRSTVAGASGRQAIVLGDVANGVYFIRLSQGSRAAVARVAVTH